MFVLIVVLVRPILHITYACYTRSARFASVLVVLSVLSQMFQWCKMCLMCQRLVLAVTLLLIIICLRDVIAMSSVIIVPGVCTLVMFRLFCHVSIFLIIRKYKYMQRMHGGGPKMQCQLYQPTYASTLPSRIIRRVSGCWRRLHT